MRAQLLVMARARLTRSQREEVAVGALDYITSPIFRGPLEDAIAKNRRAMSLLQSEVRAHFVSWKERWRLYQTVDLDLESLTANAQRVVQGDKAVAIGRLKPEALKLPPGAD